ncbi:MAG: hypothetical protein KDD63_19205 [Bacteroidetes bacterium]|nr:hypothetical protein [Bacteroidota bacterium]
MKNIILLLITLLFWSCQPNPQQPEEENYIPETLIQKAVETHGGLAKWRSYHQLSFDVLTGSEENINRETILTDLNSRYEKISGEGYQMGYDGTNYWYKLEEEGKEPNTKFMINLNFYFFAMPFVLADPGVNEENLGRKTLNGKEYEVVKATFDPGTGVAPDDQYILYLDPETYQLEILLYSVTYFNKENATQYNALYYREWQEADGLKVPKTIVRHYWDAENQALGDSRGEKSFENVGFSEEKAALSTFSAPEHSKVVE